MAKATQTVIRQVMGRSVFAPQSFPPQKPNTRGKHSSLNAAETEKWVRVDIVVYRRRVPSIRDVIEPAAQSQVEAQYSDPPLGVQIQRKIVWKATGIRRFDQLSILVEDAERIAAPPFQRIRQGEFLYKRRRAPCNQAVWRVKIDRPARLRAEEWRVQAEIENGVRPRGRARVGSEDQIPFPERPAGRQAERVIAIFARIGQLENGHERRRRVYSLQFERVTIYPTPPDIFRAEINISRQLSFKFHAPAEGARRFQPILVQGESRLHRSIGQQRHAVTRKELIYAPPLQGARHEIEIRGVIKKARPQGQFHIAVFRQQCARRQAWGRQNPLDEAVTVKPDARFDQQPIRDGPPILQVNAGLDIVAPGLRCAVE